MYILRARPEWTPFHLCHAPSARRVRVPVWKQILQGFGYDMLVVLVINRDKFRLVGHHAIPDILWCETFDTQGQRVLVSIHHMHILHGCSEAAFLFWTEPLKLEQRCIIVKHPNISLEGSFVQDNTLHNLLKLIPTRIWMLASLPSMGRSSRWSHPYSLQPRSVLPGGSPRLFQPRSQAEQRSETRVLGDVVMGVRNGPAQWGTWGNAFDVGQVRCKGSPEPSARTT